MLLSQKLKIHFVETLQLLKKLTEIESPSGREEEVANFIIDYLEEIGYRPRLEESNVLLNPERDFMVTTHLDTVEVLTPFSFDGEYAYGTGVADAKASITAILLTLEKLDKPSFGVAFFYDEEEDGKGSENFSKKYKPSKAVVMEPTDMAIATAHYGGIEAKIKVKGKAAHGATPEKGENAIEKCLELLNQLKNLKNIIVSVQKIVGGSDTYVIPSECEARVEFTFKPEIKAETVLNELRKICEGKAEIETKDVYDGFVSEKVAGLMRRALEKAGVEVRFSEMPSWSDAVNLYMAGCDVAVFGPGELFRCHTQEERVRLKDVELARDVLIALNGLL